MAMNVKECVKHPIRMMISYVAPKRLASIYYRNVSNKSMD